MLLELLFAIVEIILERTNDFMNFFASISLILICCTLLFISIAHCAGNPTDSDQDIEIMKERFREILLQKVLNPPLLGFCAEGWTQYDNTERTALMKEWSETLGPDGRWPDLDYENRRASDWPLKSHTARTGAMAIEYNRPTGKYFQNPELLAAIKSSFDFWVLEDIQCPNWYPNQITVPGNIGAILLFMEPELTPEQYQGGLGIIERVRASGTGANLAETAMNQIAYACLAGNAELLRQTYEQLTTDLLDFTRQGVKEDFSFHYHGAQIYSGAYGAVYTRSMGRLAYISDGTRFQFSEEAKDILYAYILDGQRWMIYGGTFDYGVIGRSIAIPEPKRKVSQHLVPGVKAFADCFGARQEQLKDFLQNLPDNEDLEGNRMFWQSDFMVHRRDGFYYSIRMCSNRTHNAEICNGEGYKAHRTADGMTLMMTDGDEYDAIFPVWDWKRSPGITGEFGSEQLSGNPRLAATNWFAGGVSDGRNGAAALDFTRGDTQAKKSWFCFDDIIVCVGSDIVGPTDAPLITSINQCLLDGETLLEGKAVGPGEHQLKSPVRILHDGIGYLVAEGGAVQFKCAQQSGSWTDINRNQPPGETTKEVFSLWIDHGVGAENAGYIYYVLPNADVQALDELSEQDSIRVIEKSSAIHSVHDAASGLYQIVFWQPGRFKDPQNDLMVVSDRPSLVMVQEEDEGIRLTVSKPGRIHEGEDNSLTLGINRHLKDIPFDDEQGLSRVSTDLPISGNSGKPQQCIFKNANWSQTE